MMMHACNICRVIAEPHFSCGTQSSYCKHQNYILNVLVNSAVEVVE